MKRGEISPCYPVYLVTHRLPKGRSRLDCPGSGKLVVSAATVISVKPFPFVLTRSKQHLASLSLSRFSGVERIPRVLDCKSAVFCEPYMPLGESIHSFCPLLSFPLFVLCLLTTVTPGYTSQGRLSLPRRGQQIPEAQIHCSSIV